MALVNFGALSEEQKRRWLRMMYGSSSPRVEEIYYIQFKPVYGFWKFSVGVYTVYKDSYTKFPPLALGTYYFKRNAKAALLKLRMKEAAGII